MSSRRLRWVVGIYLVLLLASTWVRIRSVDPILPDDVPQVFLHEVDSGRRGENRVRVAYLDLGPLKEATNVPAKPALLLLHGSPGDKSNFDRMLPLLAQERRVLIPDLPGFGESERDVADYSVEAHAIYIEEFLDEVNAGPVHVVGYSMGGGVALELVDRIPADRYLSLTLFASIGVQELELLGDRRLNRFVHAGQLAGLWALHNLVPHFGRLDGSMLDQAYARNFYDTDQRPLRGILRRLEMPTFVLHGQNDFLVPPEAALEHYRIVPHSELTMLEGSDHFMPFTEGPQTARRLLEFFDRVDRGEAPTRAQAVPERLAAAARKWDPQDAPKAAGFALIVVLLLIAVATLVSEDLTCIGVGLMVSQGRIDFLPGTVACFLGIFVGDLLLYFAGRFVGRPALRRAPLRWWLSEERVEAAGEWFRRRGAIVILLSRFMPGARLPTYFAAGTLKTGFLAFAAYFFVAVALWTPLLVALSMVLGEQAFDSFESFRRNSIWMLPLLALWILVMVKAILPLATHAGRRRLVGIWRRWTRWEFWPPWLFYPPVVVWALWLGLKYRGALLFTAVNPAIPDSGFIDESKSEILDVLAKVPDNRERIAPYLLLQPGGVEARWEAMNAWMDAQGIAYPVVLKPDAGQRGSGVAIVRSAEAAAAYMRNASDPILVQAYVPGIEFGLFWYRMPAANGTAPGTLFSITEKVMPFVAGDGERTVEQLIADDPRAVAMAQHYIALQQRGDGAASLRVPLEGERVQLAELGTHCLGAIFLDGEPRRTAALEQAVDAIGQRCDGINFGRYDVRCPSVDALMRGEFTVIELNGVTSEATHIYDPRHSLFSAYRTLFRQWEIAFRIGAVQRERGQKVSHAWELIAALRAYRRRSRGYSRRTESAAKL